ncbi:transcription/translation regulatory transformer protein RfaH [Kineobactrum sediminis]|uniref:Transcription/translation regulatory transformer protein RfaH n=1 Tax=Kineobactrum sediminis TaxID=1905677 RepID=A0A2N5XXU7_9GAMM|nr:transcription termination/antitermination NusG family protein [Kineobactrum sediminis]PLW80977.1 transcription/translation regulatory transformer protein RfaH [Kineobactrum sediminis]
MTWLVVHSKPREEEKAARNLRDQNFTTFLPCISQRKRRREGWQTVIGPLFPRYLFVKVALGEQSTATVRSTPGVANLVRFGQVLAPIPDAVIDFLVQQQTPELNARQAEAWTQKPGDKVTILEGPFAGLPAVFKMARDADRAALLVELLGRQNEVVVSRDVVGEGV